MGWGRIEVVVMGFVMTTCLPETNLLLFSFFSFVSPGQQVFIISYKAICLSRHRVTLVISYVFIINLVIFSFLPIMLIVLQMNCLNCNKDERNCVVCYLYNKEVR